MHVEAIKSRFITGSVIKVYGDLHGFPDNEG